MESSGWDHDCGHDGSDVEGGPDEHEFIEESLFFQMNVSSFLYSVLNWDSSGIVHGVRVVSVIIGLDQIPVGG